MTDDWTPVKRKGRHPAKVSLPQLASPSTSTPGAPLPATSTLSEIKKAHSHYHEQWTSSGVPKRLKEILARIRGAGTVVRKAVCLGSGGFDGELGWAVRRRGHMQALAFLEIVAGLRGSDEIKCFFQEPGYTSVDKEFLESLGHTVVDSPAGFEQIDGETLIFGIHLYAPIYNLALENRQLPSVFIGTGWEAWDDTRLSLETKRPMCIKEIHEGGYDVVEFPQDDGYTFSSTVIYWKRQTPGSLTTEEKSEAKSRNPVVKTTAKDEKQYKQDTAQDEEDNEKPKPQKQNPEPESELKQRKQTPEPNPKDTNTDDRKNI